MKFQIASVDVWKNAQKLIEKYPCLSDYTFEVEETSFSSVSRIHDENGRLIYQPFTQVVRTPYIHVDTIEDLVKLAYSVDNPLIIHNNTGVIEIYDDYRE